MDTLIRFFIIFKTFFVFVLLELVSLVLYFSFNNFQHGQYLNASNTVAGKLYEVRSSITDYMELGNKNWELARENAMLKNQLYAANKALEYFREDSTYAVRKKVAEDNNYSFMAARVVNATFTKAHNYLTLDKGSAEGVRPEMGVVCQAGVVGIVSAVSEHFSLVIPVLNVSSRISVKVKDKSQTGTLVWKGDDYRYASLEDVPSYIPVAKGDTIITSGYSSIFPEGVFVGKIVKTERGKDQLQKLNVGLGPDFSKLVYVDIINFKNAEEMKKLEKEGTNNE